MRHADYRHIDHLLSMPVSTNYNSLKQTCTYIWLFHIVPKLDCLAPLSVSFHITKVVLYSSTLGQWSVNIHKEDGNTFPTHSIAAHFHVFAQLISHVMRTILDYLFSGLFQADLATRYTWNWTLWWSIRGSGPEFWKAPSINTWSWILI